MTEYFTRKFRFHTGIYKTNNHQRLICRLLLFRFHTGIYKTKRAPVHIHAIERNDLDSIQVYIKLLSGERLRLTSNLDSIQVYIKR